MSIIAADSVASFFDEVVEDALKARHIEVTPVAARYLVGVLSDYAHPDERHTALDRPLALSLQEALVMVEPAERFERLRQLGDAVLYASGFFADHFAARGIETRYVFGIGSRAYVSAGAMLSPSTGLFEELASRFDELASVLSEVADMTLTQSSANAGPRGVLKLYERWLKTKSDTLAGALAEHGLFPSRATKGVQ